MTDKVQLIKQEIERLKTLVNRNESYGSGFIDSLLMIDGFIDNLQEEHINFPHERNIVDKVFGAGNLESFEHSEAERLVLLDKEELLKDLEINKEPASEDLEEEIDKIWKTCDPIDEGMGVETANIHIEQFDDIAKHFVEWQKQKSMQDFLEKACEWLKDNSKKYVVLYEDGYSHYAYNSMIEDFKNHMQNESEN